MGYGSLLNGWSNLAKTSYGAKVTFDEDVRMYTWKKLDDIDSSTLIECNISGTSLPDLTLDMKAIIRAEINSDPGTYGNLLYKKGGVEYIHAGVVFFGGGKNYSVIEDKSDKTLGTYSDYSAGLDQVGLSHLNKAAGYEDFFFMIYDGNNSTFTYDTQQNMTGKYDCLRAK